MFDTLASKFAVSNNSWRDRFDFQRDPKTIDVGWSEVRTIGRIRAPLDVLRLILIAPGGKCLARAEETPHYELIRSLSENHPDSWGFEEYCKYFRNSYPEQDLNETVLMAAHLISVFSMKSEEDNPISIVTYPPVETKDSSTIIAVFDGTHRAAIAAYLGYKSVECQIVDGKLSLDDFLSVSS